MSLTQTTDATFETDVFQSKGVTLVDFWAPWCGPCRVQGPILEKYAEAHPDVRILKHNTDENPEVAGAFGIQSIPTLVVFVDGKLVLGGIGVHDAGRLDVLVAEAKKRAAAAEATPAADAK